MATLPSMERAARLLLFPAVVLVVGSFAAWLQLPAVDEGFTELYLLGPDGDAAGYETSLGVNESGEVSVAARSHERARAAYVLTVTADRGHHEGEGVNRTFVPDASTNLGAHSLTLAPGEAWRRPFTYAFAEPGLHRLGFRLAQSSDPAAEALEVRLWVTVSK